MKDHHGETLPDRILGLQRLEDLFNLKGYLICQSTGERIYDFDKLVAIFIPVNSKTDLILTVHSDHAKELLQTYHSSLQ